jgi:hypothetical protein
LYLKECDSINNIKIGLHVLAALAVIGGIYRAVTAVDAALASMLMSQYLLWAILFEVAALNVRE